MHPPSVRKCYPTRVLDPKRYCTLVSVFARPCLSAILNLPPCGPGIGLEPVGRQGHLLSLVAPACKRFPIRTLDSKRYCTLVSVFTRQRPSVSLPDPGGNRRLG